MLGVIKEFFMTVNYLSSVIRIFTEAKGPLMDSQSLRKQVNDLTWVHQIDLGNGVITPGRWPKHPLISDSLDRISFDGKKFSMLELGMGCGRLRRRNAEHRWW